MTLLKQLKNETKQAFALSLVNIKSFPQRLISSSISMLSIACVAAVLLAVLAMTQGMIKTLERTGLDNTLIVMRAGAISELQSVMFPMEVKLLANHQQVVKEKGKYNTLQPLYSAEMFVNAELSRAQGVHTDVHEKANVEKLALRGISTNTYHFRPNFQMVAGERFNTGLRQVIIGQAIARRMPELMVGSTITLGGTDWTISGIFSDNNSVFESELWADIGMLQSDYQRGNTVQSIRLAIKADTDIQALNEEWQADPRLNVRLMLEKQFFAEQGENLTRLIRWIGLPVAVIMAFGAMIAALNTMYAVVASRSKEIATHKAIGFSPFAILCSILTEALAIAIVGAVLGTLPLYLLFDGWTAATQNAANLSQLMFNFDISIALIAQALLLSVLIGLLGGILPAIKAMRLSVTAALRTS